MKKFSIEVITLASDIVEVEAETRKDAERIVLDKAKQLVDFNKYNEDCVRVKIAETMTNITKNKSLITFTYRG